MFRNCYNLILIIILAFVLGSCRGKEYFESILTQDTSTIKYPVKINPLTLDPAKVTDYQTRDVLIQIYEGLVKYDANNKIVPAIAKSWKHSKDGRSFTFKLRPNGKFHNGKEVTAEDVKWSFERACWPKMYSPTADNFLSDIQGVKDCLAGKTKTIQGIKVIDRLTIRFNLEKPCFYFPSKLTVPVASILPKNCVPETEITSPGHAIGTGAFKLDEFHPHQLIILKANKNYYEKFGDVKKVEISILPDSVLSTKRYQRGEFNFCYVPPFEILNIKNDEKYNKELKIFKRAAIYYLELNPSTYAPFQDERIRKAFCLSIDRDYLANGVARGMILPAKNIVYSDKKQDEHKELNLGFNPKRARELLKEAGYPNPKSLPPLEVYSYQNASGTKIMSENLIVQLNTNLGIRVKLKEVAYGMYVQKLQRREIPIRYAGLVADYLDPAQFLKDYFSSDSRLNRCAYSNPEFDKLCNLADNLHKGPKRDTLYNQAEKILLKDCCVLPIFYSINAYLIQKDIQGWQFNALGMMPFNKITFKKS